MGGRRDHYCYCRDILYLHLSVFQNYPSDCLTGMISHSNFSRYQSYCAVSQSSAGQARSQTTTPEDVGSPCIHATAPFSIRRCPQASVVHWAHASRGACLIAQSSQNLKHTRHDEGPFHAVWHSLTERFAWRVGVLTVEPPEAVLTVSWGASWGYTVGILLNRCRH